MEHPSAALEHATSWEASEHDNFDVFVVATSVPTDVRPAPQVDIRLKTQPEAHGCVNVRRSNVARPEFATIETEGGVVRF